MKEQRLNFSDYSAEQQEKDIVEAIKKVHKPILFVLKVDGEWAHLDYQLHYKFYEDKNLFQMYNEVKRTHPEHRLKYIINEGLENYLRDMKRRERKYKQLQIDWGKNDDRGY
jgi:hypothetical protein